MMNFRLARPTDADRIAHLHARSWQLHYRGIWPDAYLDGPVLRDRLQVWHNRLSHEDSSRRIMLLEQQGNLVGFACSFLDRDPVWGALLDNIHVSPAFQGKGLGWKLMQDAAQWIHHERPESGMFLWVLEENAGAVGFYEKKGGKRMERKADDIPHGGEAWICRYVWEDLASFL